MLRWPMRSAGTSHGKSAVLYPRRSAGTNPGVAVAKERPKRLLKSFVNYFLILLYLLRVNSELG
jgi:hypothetical protein